MPSLCHAFDKYDFLLSYVAFCKCICVVLTRFSSFVEWIHLSITLIFPYIKLIPLPHHTVIIYTNGIRVHSNFSRYKKQCLINAQANQFGLKSMNTGKYRYAIQSLEILTKIISRDREVGRKRKWKSVSVCIWVWYELDESLWRSKWTLSTVVSITLFFIDKMCSVIDCTLVLQSWMIRKLLWLSNIIFKMRAFQYK